MSKKKNSPKSNYEIYQSIRKDWGDINPVTKIKNSNKTQSRREYKKKDADLVRNYRGHEFLEEDYDE